MLKLTVIEGSAATVTAKPELTPEPPGADEALVVLKDFLKIGDPAVQLALADLVAALSRATH